jgi:hypothetical protein
VKIKSFSSLVNEPLSILRTAAHASHMRSLRTRTCRITPGWSVSPLVLYFLDSLTGLSQNLPSLCCAASNLVVCTLGHRLRVKCRLCARCSRACPRPPAPSRRRC